MSMTYIPVDLHLGAFIIGLSSFDTVHILLVTFASQPPSHDFPKDVKEMLLMCSQLCVFLVVMSSIGKFGSMPD